MFCLILCRILGTYRLCDVYDRIRTERNGGAWCPKQQISRDIYEWLEVDLGQLKVVTQVETQGRFGNGQVCTCHQYDRVT